ncbi:hypothetical protein BDN70DRAFT_900169 [Pholiota conissans]|uniref:Uncharacterized protein n=1 Tax=Pholiota conissans TaxID=109636 RepID=A0A9P5YPX2_9AGAR|nr:hypothetical protein BDN70DRAFT_900169 [Pholiota conissans]
MAIQAIRRSRSTLLQYKNGGTHKFMRHIERCFEYTDYVAVGFYIRCTIGSDYAQAFLAEGICYYAEGDDQERGGCVDGGWVIRGRSDVDGPGEGTGRLETSRPTGLRTSKCEVVHRVRNLGVVFESEASILMKAILSFESTHLARVLVGCTGKMRWDEDLQGGVGERGRWRYGARAICGSSRAIGHEHRGLGENEEERLRSSNAYRRGRGLRDGMVDA